MKVPKALSTLLVALAVIWLPMPALAAPERGLDQRIDAAVEPIAKAVSSAIFYAVPINGTVFPLIVGWLILAGIVFTLYFRFVNVWGFAHGFRLIRGDYSDPSHPGEVSHFQALTSAVSGTVGLGNIAGVAVAITIGGPGATLWMILAGLLGMSTKFVECTLGVMYRLERADGTISGGPMYYLSRGLGQNYPRLKTLGWVLAVAFAVCTMFGAIGAGAMFQANQAYSQFLAATGGSEGILAGRAWLFGLLYAALAGVVVIGGITRIGSVTARLVPAMTRHLPDRLSRRHRRPLDGRASGGPGHPGRRLPPRERGGRRRRGADPGLPTRGVLQ